MPVPRLFDTRNNSTEVRHYLGLPAKKENFHVDQQWDELMHITAMAYSQADFDMTRPWRYLSFATKEIAVRQVVVDWQAKGTSWDATKIEQVSLWRLQILHKRGRDQNWRRRKSKSSNPPETETDFEEQEPEPEPGMRPHIPSHHVRTTPYDPVREAAQTMA